jgi:hypothetical protein
MTITRTYTKTYTLLDAWASTTPHERGSGSSPEENDPCAVESCGKSLERDEECYAVTQLEGWVCWRHIRPNDGPIKI